MFKTAIPLLHVSDSEAAIEFYVKRLGFEVRFANRIDPSRADPCYAGVSRDGAFVHVSSFPGDGVSGGVVNFPVDDVDALHDEFAAAGVEIAMSPVDQTWGTREMYVRDLDDNSLRFMQMG